MNTGQAEIKGDLWIKPLPISIAKAPKWMAFYKCGSQEIIDGAAYAWLIRGSQKNILIDCGEIELERVKSHGIMETGDVKSVVDGVKEEGLSPEDIDLIISTHLHAEHIAGARHFPNAKIVVQKKEIISALSPCPALEWIYPQQVIRPLFESNRFEFVDGDVEIEPGIDLILTPGHSAGGQSVILQSGDKKVVVTGFCCADENFDAPEPNLEVQLMGLFEDINLTYQSMVKVKNMADLIVPLHESRFFEMQRIP